MGKAKLSWQEELAIVDRTMKAISDVSDPEELVKVYWDGIGDLIPSFDYVAMSRRGIEPPAFLITRSSRFTEHWNPWTQRDKLPRMIGGLLGELVFANRPVIIDDLPARLAPDDPGRFYLEGFKRLVALPQYDKHEALNVTAMLLHDDVEFDPASLPILHWQSGLFGRGTQNLVLRNQLAAALASLDRELQVVGEIQRSLLPAQLPSIPGFELAADYETSARAGGDYYDFFPLPCGKWGIFIADVSGHGTPAAVLMAITHAIAHAQPGTHTPPGSLLAYLNQQLTKMYAREGSFVTAFYAVLDPATRSLSFSRAGHNPPRLVRDAGVISVDQSGAMPLGIFEGQVFEQSSITLQPGDLLLLYTDGINEAMSPPEAAKARELWGVDRLDEVLIAGGGISAARSIERIRDELAAFCGNSPATDDRTLIAMRCLK